MQPKPTAGRRARAALMVALIVAGLWAGTSFTRGAAHPEQAPTGPVAHISRVVDVIKS